jgi:hypothetical protein
MKNRLVLSRLIALLALALASPLAFAESTSTTAPTAGGADQVSAGIAGKSELTDTLPGRSVTDSLYLNYFATYHGPSLSNINAYTVDRTGKQTKQGQFLDSEVTAAYTFADRRFGIGPVIPFLAYPVLGQGLVIGDVGIKAFDRKTVSTDGLSVYTNVIVQAPTAQSSKDRDMTWALKTTPNVRYEIPSTRFTTGAWTEAKAYFGVSKDKTFKLYAAPYVNYQLIRNVSLNLEYEMEWHHDVNQIGYMNFTTYQTDLQPGLVWNITSHVLINPYVQFFTTNQATADRTALGAVVSASLL